MGTELHRETRRKFEKSAFWSKKSQVVYANLQRGNMELDRAGTQDDDDDDDEREIRISRRWIEPPA